MKLKIGYLNAWAGQQEALLPFLNELFRELDVLFLSEVHSSPTERMMVVTKGKNPGHHINARLYEDICELASGEFFSMFAPQINGLHDLELSCKNVKYGNAVFWRKSLNVLSQRASLLYGPYDQYTGQKGTDVYASRTGLAISLERGCKTEALTVASSHGLWCYSDKGDVPARQEQLNRLARLAEEVNKEVALQSNIVASSTLLLGDLNIRSSTMTIDSLLQAKCFTGYGVHLNSRFGVTCTRTPFYDGDEKEADHAIASWSLLPGLHYEVRTDVPSDHALLEVTILDF